MPVTVTPPASVAMGEGHGLSVKVDGTVWAWGQNDHGQLGDGTTTNRLRAHPDNQRN
jgi:alpha-tubulin suppressor-like RCC1 family protein